MKHVYIQRSCHLRLMCVYVIHMDKCEWERLKLMRKVHTLISSLHRKQSSSVPDLVAALPFLSIKVAKATASVWVILTLCVSV